MGKNRKAKQVVNQTEIQSEDDGCYHRDDEEVPLDFLTSDDFQVVQKKRYQASKKSSDEVTDNAFSISRSRSHSERFLDKEDDFGCHAGFWTVRNHETAAVDAVNLHPSKKKVGLLKLKSEGDLSVKFQSKCDAAHNGLVSNPGKNLSSEVKKDCQSDDEKLDENVDSAKSKVSATLNCASHDKFSNEFQEFKKPKNVGSLKQSLSNGGNKIPQWRSVKEELRVNQNCVLGRETSTNLSVKENVSAALNVDGVDSNLATNVSLPNVGNIVESTPAVESVNSASEGTVLKSSSRKKKNKKSRSKQNDGGCAEPGTTNPSPAPNGLATSSSSDFSEMSNAEKSKNAAEKTKKEESAKRDRKRPSKKQLEAIHEALRKAKEEEERVKREEEAKRKQAEEAEKQALERQRLEQEKKEKKKLKEKQKREKLRSEGRLLSKSQKQARARLAATLEAFRQQGVEVPQIGEKRPRGPKLGNYKNSHRKRLDSSQSDTSQVNNNTTIKSERHKSESLSSQESSGKESLSDLPSSFDSKDSLDLYAGKGFSLTTESDGGNFSCSEESDDDQPLSADVPSTKEVLACKLKESVSKSNLSKLNTNDVKIVEESKNSVKLRSPVVCVLGHVDTGKTKLLDYIRKTHVQDSEAGGITQQIGATMIPQGALKEKCKMVEDFRSFEMKVPGLLVIDTPGHEAFRNLRVRGTAICDIAILVVDIMHGLEPQTIESINLLKTGKIPFVVALNKIDRLYGWKSAKDDDVESTVKNQSHNTLMEFKKRCQEIILQFANLCLNATLYYENRDPRKFVSMVPTSAITGDGMGNLLSLITKLTQTLMYKELIFTEKLQATVLEVKVISGLGTTIDVILVNGRLQEGDTVVLAGQDGPIVTQIRSLLMPQPLKELRVKNPYIEYKLVEGAQGVKVTGRDLEKSIAGLSLYVAQNPSEVDILKAKISYLLDMTMSCIKTSERGVYVQASTLGSLEALLEYLTSSNIPYFGVKVGPVVKKDVMKASIMLEHDVQYATILAFDVKIERDAQDLADSLGVKIIQANIIYHLVDEFLKHKEAVNKKREEMKHLAVFPCMLRLISPVSSGDPMVYKVFVEAGSLREGTPLCVPTKGNMDLGTVCDIKVSDKSTGCAKEGENATVTMDRQQPKAGELDEEDCIASRITRQSVEVCKEYFRDELDPSDWPLMSELKKMLHTHV